MANLLVASFAIVAPIVGGAIDPGPGDVPLPTPSCPRPATAVMVGGPLAGTQGHALVRWFPTEGMEFGPAPVDGAYPTFEIWRSRDGGDMQHVATLTRAQTAAEATARLQALGGDDVPLLIEKASAINATVGATVLGALEVFERPSSEMARGFLATQLWRAAWALGLAWLDQDLHDVDVSLVFQYEVRRLAFGGAAQQTIASIPKVFHGADVLPKPTGVVASTIEDLQGEGELEPLYKSDASGDWSRSQRLRWGHLTIRVAWDAGDGQPCDPAAPAKWGAGYDLFRRHCTLLGQNNVCLQGTTVQVNDPTHAIFPMSPQHECVKGPDGEAVLDAQGHCTSNDTAAAHFEVRAFYTDNSTSLQQNEFYCYKVRQRNLLGAPGIASAEACAEALDTTPPAPPDGFTIELVNNRPFLHWTPPTDEAGVDEPVTTYEVWRTALLRQDWLPDPADPNAPPPPPLQAWQGTVADRWKILATLPGDAVSFTDHDPAVVEGKHFWYRVRAIDDATSAMVQGFKGNPSAFTRPLSIGPKDLTPPQTCSGAGTPFAPRTCLNLTFPSQGLPVLAGLGCISFSASIDPQYRRILWFHGDDEAGANMHLVKVFHNNGQKVFCNDLDLPWDIKLCVKLQGEDAVGNKGPAALAALPCRFPSFGLDVPPPPKPVITEVKPVDPANPVQAKVAWDAAAEPWLAKFHLLESSTATPILGADGCPQDFQDMFLKTLGKGARSTTEALSPVPVPGEAFLIYYIVAAENTAGERACSVPAGYTPGSVLPKAYHALGGEDADLNFCQAFYSPQQGGVVLKWHWNPPGTERCGPPLKAWFVVYRSLHPTHGFVAITPPISSHAYVDTDAPDARFYYQVAFVAHELAADGTLLNGEIGAVTDVVAPIGPKPTWPAPAPSSPCPIPAFQVETAIKKVTFGEGARRFTMDVCWYKHEGASLEKVVQVGLGGLHELVARTPPRVQPVANQVIGSVQPIAEALPQAASPSFPMPAPVTISGFGLVRVQLPGLGLRQYLHAFQNLTVLPGMVQNDLSAKVLSGQVTQATAAPGIVPLHTPSAGGTAFRLKLTAWTLDKDGGRATMQLRAPEDVRFTLVPSLPYDHDFLGLGTLPITPSFQFRKVVSVGGSPDQCSGPLRFAFDLTTLPLRVRPDATFALTLHGMEAEQGGSTPVEMCTAYRDPYDPDLSDPGQPSRAWPPSDRRHVDSNDAFLRPAYTGQGLLRPQGMQASLVTPGPVAWVPTAPFGFFVEAPGPATLVLQGGAIQGGSIAGPIEVSMAYHVGATAPRREVTATFPGPLNVFAGGAMVASLGSAGPSTLPFGNGGMNLVDIADGAWTLVLGRVQLRRTVAEGAWSDDHAQKDAMGPRDDAYELGLNYRVLPAFEQETTWKCLGSFAPKVRLDTRVDVYLRQSGLSHEVEADIPVDSPIKLNVRGYDADLLRFHAMYLDSVIVDSDIRVIVNLPHPARIEVPLFHVQLNQTTNCVMGGDAPDGLVVKAEAWQLELAPQSGEFRTVPAAADDPALPGDACHDPPQALPEHCEEDFPHWQFWLLGEADLPHLHDDHPAAPGAPAGWQGVRFDEAWKPWGQVSDTFTVAPMLRLDGFNFTASDIRLGRAFATAPCSTPGSLGVQACSPGSIVIEEEDEQPDPPGPDTWHGGNLAPPPCAGTYTAHVTVREGRCPPFLRYVGHLQLPYWAQGTQHVVATAFVHGVRNQTGTGASAPQPMAHADYLGLSQPTSFVRGWTEKSGVPDQEVTLWYAQRPHDFDPATPPPEQGVFAGFMDRRPFGGAGPDAATYMDVGTVVSTLAPCSNDKGCGPADPDVRIVNGIVGGVAVLRATADVLHPGAPDAASLGTGPASPPDVATKLGIPGGAAAPELAGLDNLWAPMSAACPSDSTCYLNAQAAVDAELVALPGGATLDAGLPDWLKALEAAGGEQSAEVDKWDIGIGQMRSTIVFETKANGDFVFVRLEADIKFDDDSTSNFVTAEKVRLTIDNEGVLLIQGEGLKSIVLDFAGKPTIDFTVRLEGAPTPRFDGGISVYGVTLGTIDIQYVHGVFGAGINDLPQAFMYFGISGQGSDTSSGVTVGMSLLVGTIDEKSKPILKAHGFKELVDTIGETGGATLTGVYARAYAQIPIFGSGCMLSINAGAEIGMWYFDVQDDDADGFVFGSKLRGFATGDLICLVTIRGDITIWTQIKEVDGETIFSAGGEGWVAGGLGFCDSETWTDWDAHFWDDGWCMICGQHMELIYNGSDFEVEGSVACG